MPPLWDRLERSHLQCFMVYKASSQIQPWTQGKAPAFTDMENWGLGRVRDLTPGWWRATWCICSSNLKLILPTCRPGVFLLTKSQKEHSLARGSRLGLDCGSSTFFLCDLSNFPPAHSHPQWENDRAFLGGRRRAVGRQRDADVIQWVTLLSALVCESASQIPRQDSWALSPRTKTGFPLQTDMHAQNLEKWFPKRLENLFIPPHTE